MKSFLTFSILVLDKKAHKDTEAMNLALKYEYQKMIDVGYKNIFYLESGNALGLDQEGTVDGVHFTDLGFMRYANHLIENLKSFDLLWKKYSINSYILRKPHVFMGLSAPEEGLEPPTKWLTVTCSTNWATPEYKFYNFKYQKESGIYIVFVL